MSSCNEIFETARKIKASNVGLVRKKNTYVQKIIYTKKEEVMDGDDLLGL